MVPFIATIIPPINLMRFELFTLKDAEHQENLSILEKIDVLNDAYFYATTPACCDSSSVFRALPAELPK